jgi:hypothetical protein
VWRIIFGFGDRMEKIVLTKSNIAVYSEACIISHQANDDEMSYICNRLGEITDASRVLDEALKGIDHLPDNVEVGRIVILI